MSDILREATLALASERRPEHETAARTRRRVLDSLEQRERRRRRRLLTLVPLAAVLIGTSAMAADAARDLFDRAATTEPQQAAIGAVAMVARALAPAPQLAQQAKPSEPAVIDPAMIDGAPTTKPAAPTPDADPTLALYRRAHEAHFGGGSPGEALDLWNRYLAAAPGGTFAPEAMFNRAICLLRMGRSDRARAALAPFASGQLGGYRKQEAERLLEALR